MGMAVKLVERQHLGNNRRWNNPRKSMHSFHKNGVKGFTPKMDPFGISHHLCEEVECFRVFLVRSLSDFLAAT